MKKLKGFLFWFFKVGLSALLIIFLCVAPFSVFPSLSKKQGEINKSEVFEYQGILELWHVETFEGGSVSRATFLEREAYIFEKEHKGTYISIQTMSPEQFCLNISLGKTPNILSFGIGVGDDFLSNLIELDTKNVRSDIKTGGVFNSKQLAVPYLLGGYATIKNKNFSSKTKNSNLFGVGTLGSINVLKCLQKNNIKLNKLSDLAMDTYTAYDRFIKNNFQTLIGTQRDVYRCYSRQQRGLFDVEFSFLSGWTDLVQYISVFSASELEEEMCKKFASQITSTQAQNKLKDYNLFSVLNNVCLYETGLFANFEKVLKESLQVESVFLNLEQIEIQKKQALKSVVFEN